jgi:hypothetical protein
MKKIPLFLLATMLTVSWNVSAAKAEDIVPVFDNLKVECDSTVSDPLIKNFLGKKMFTKWYSPIKGFGVSSILIIEKYNGPDNIIVAYSWSQAKGYFPAGKLRLSAALKDGVLTINFPKKSPTQTRIIELRIESDPDISKGMCLLKGVYIINDTNLGELRYYGDFKE